MNRALSTTSLSPAGEAALETLMSCLPADLSRVAKLREVHAACSAAGVVDARSTAETSAGDDDDGAGDVARLHSLFDAAVRHGASSLVCHYVDEVCGRDDFSSADGVEAYLRDGEMVAEWAVASTRGAEALLASAFRVHRLERPAAADGRGRTAAAVFEATQDVLGLLGARPDAAGEPEPLEQHRGAGRRRAGRRRVGRRVDAPKASDVVRRREPGLRARRGAGVARARGARRRHHAGQARRTRGVDRRGPRAPSGGGGGERGRARGVGRRRREERRTSRCPRPR